MTWEEIIIDIRKKPEYSQLVKDSYFGEDLIDCVERYKASEEFYEILRIIKSKNNSDNLTILDLGAGNGITSISFALSGYNVVALEPDPSNTVGAGAIEILKKHYSLQNIEIMKCYAEDLGYNTETFDVVFARQSMHHAYKLIDFVSQASRVLKKSGMYFSIRDHVVNNEIQKAIFLESHPLHRYYGGENAFSLEEYKFAITNANLNIILSLGPFDNVINYYPETLLTIKEKFEKKFLFSLKVPNLFFKLFLIFRKLLTNNYSNSPGRLYSFVAIKR